MISSTKDLGNSANHYPSRSMWSIKRKLIKGPLGFRDVRRKAHGTVVTNGNSVYGDVIDRTVG